MVAERVQAPGGLAASLLVVLLTLGLVGCGVRRAGQEVESVFAEYAGREVERVRFIDSAPFSADTLLDLIETQPPRCQFLGLPICFGGIGEQRSRLDLPSLARDERRLESFYRASGFFGTRVVPAVEPVDDGVEVTFVIYRGDPVYVDSLAVTGIEGVVDPGILEKLPLKVGALFDLGDFAASSDTIERALLDRGHAYAQVLRNYSVDTIADRASAVLVAIPGPRVVVDSIIVTGAEHLGRRAVLRQLSFRKGDLLRLTELVESQRNLYNLEIVQFATVSVAPDSLQGVSRDSSRATVLVQITEGPVHVVEAAVGFGTVECFRSNVRWVSRSFAGGARRLALTGSVSKIGIGKPLDAGFASSICPAFEDDPFQRLLDYRFTADLTQPWFLSPRNHLTVHAFAERQSEPRVYQLEAQGASFTVTRRLGDRETLTGILNGAHRRANATPAVLCAALLVCLPSDIADFNRYLWLNTVALNWVRDRSVPVTEPARGYLVRSGIAWAAPWLGSDLQFTRGIAEGSKYQTLRPDWVLALHLRLGSFFNSATIEPNNDFVPPEERFYAGGANTVRGFARNELGPGVYVAEGPVFDSTNVTFIPVGGTGTVIANAELRFPAPFARNVLRLAVFIDAGAITLDDPPSPEGNDLRITPGVGFRVRTPVGPVRLDIAYNPYGPIPAPLFLTDPETDALIRVLDRFTPRRESFFNRLRLNLAVGEPF